jgi:hypothetical protein
MARIASLAVLFVGLGLLGCGGDSSEDSVSKEEFVKNANQICRETEKKFEEIGESAESPEELSNALDQVIDESKQAADDLVELERPEGGDGETAKKFAEGFRSELNSKLIPALEDLRAAVKKKDAQAVQEAAQRLQQLEASESDRYARELGLTACS